MCLATLVRKRRLLRVGVVDDTLLAVGTRGVQPQPDASAQLLHTFLASSFTDGFNMGDSEDDGDYKRRDKFRTERRGYDGPVERGMTPPRRDRNSAGPGSAGPAAGSDWREPRNASSGGSWAGNRRYDASSAGPGASGGYRRDRYPSPPAHAGRRGHDFSPPHKRIRHIDSWDDRYEGGYDRGGSGYDFDRGYGSHRGYGAGSSGHTRSHAGASGAASSAMDRDSDMVQPPMMTFKTFLSTQDDSISDDEAIKKYAEYKLEFKRQQLNEFFVTHKDEEWFKLKYHPEESLKRREEQRTMLKKRVDVFMDFFNKKQMESLSIDGDQSDELIKLLDCFVIMLEGGNENDFHVLDKPSEEEQDKKSGDEDAAKSVVSQSADSADHVEEAVKAEEVTEKPAEDNEPKSVPGKKRKRKRTKEFDDDSSLSEEEDEEEEEEVDSEQQKAKNAHSEDSAAPKEDNQGEDDSNESKIVTQTNGQPEEKMETNGEDASNDEVMKKPEDENEPRALHKSTSIFLRNLAPTITKLEVEAMCKRYPGFLRAAIADPTPERRWFRRGWVTFERNAKIKEICFSLNNIRLRDCELGAIVNRDLSRRVRTVNGITVDKKVVRQDIKLAAKVITNLDKRWNLWDEECPSTNGTSGMKKKMALAENHNDDLVGLMSNNPLLANITDYLIEEASAEEEELLGRNNDLEEGEEGEEGTSISRDLELIKVLDKLLFYLRMVHSVDFYNHSEYPNEDEMPNRCGILHARGIPPSGKVTQAEIDDYTAMFEKKMGSFLQPKLDLTDDEANKLGMKNEEDEVEKFIQANTQELGKDKWLCPLSGKKFKGPDFVRKHIFNKHGEKIEEVKKEVKYYNNYLKDPKRPQLPENPQNRSSTGSGMTRQSSQRDFGSGAAGGGSRSAGHSDSRYHYSGYPREATSYPVYDDSGRHGGGYERGAGYDRGGYRARQRPDNFNRGPRMPPINDSYNSNRPIITYRDLDAPRDYEDF